MHDAYRKWLGESYDLGALDCVLCAAAAETLGGDPPWLLVIGGSGAAKTETSCRCAGAGAQGDLHHQRRGRPAVSGTPLKDRAKDATGGLLPRSSASGSSLLVIKDVTSILSMNRDTRALVLAALREIHDGRWTRNIGADGGRTLEWRGRLVVIGACTTAWDAAHQVIATMGDRFLLVRLAADAKGRRSPACRPSATSATKPRCARSCPREVGKLLGCVSARPRPSSSPTTRQRTSSALADLVTRARTAVERDFKGNPRSPTPWRCRPGSPSSSSSSPAAAWRSAWTATRPWPWSPGAPPTPCRRCASASSPTSPTTPSRPPPTW